MSSTTSPKTPVVPSDIYERIKLVEVGSIFVWPADAHGMGGSLDRYVENRLPAAALRALDGSVERIVLTSVYPTHPAALSGGDLLAPPNKAARTTNRVRPSFRRSADGSVVTVAVPPGLDYLKQPLAHLTRMPDGTLRD